jgi:outer membrane receptor protein involved in Fe transport
MNKRYLMFFPALTVGFILALGGLSSLFGQETESEEFTLEEITVTAQKRAENQQKVPIAMETISGDMIKEMGKTDIDQILSSVSSIIINKAQDGMRVTLRGMSNDQSTFHGRQVSTPTVAVNMDGAYTNRSAAGDNLYDLERVEVLYGPQSTLYSAATPGGVVNVVTASPKLDMFSTSAILEAGNFNKKHAEATINVPVASKFAFRVAANYTKRDGYLTNGADDEDSKSARLKGLFQANDKLSFTAIAEYSKQGGQGMGQNGVVLFDKQGDVDNPWMAAAGRGETVAGPQPMNDGVNKKYSGRIDWDMGFGSLAIIPSYTPRDSKSISTGTDQATGEATYTKNNGSGYEKSIEARMTSSSDFTSFKWILGAAWYHSYDEMSNDTFFSSDNGPNGYMLGYQDQKTKAVFGNITYPVTDRFRATGGLRYSTESTFSYNNEVPGRGEESVDMTYNSPDYKVGIEYDLATNSMIFSDFSTSYRTQGMGTKNDGSAFPPEKLKAFTLGSKNRFLNNRMQVNASAYYYIYKNYMAVTMIGTVSDNYDGAYDPTHTYSQAALDSPALSQEDVRAGNGNGQLDYIDKNGNGRFDFGVDTLVDGKSSPPTGQPGPPPDGTAGTANGKVTGDAKVYGIDISTSTLVTQDFKVDLSVSYLKKYFTHLIFPFDAVDSALWNMSDVDYSGKDMTFAPHLTFNATLTYNIMLPNGGTLSPTFDTRFQSSYKMYFLNEILGTSRGREPGAQITGYRVDVSKSSRQEPYHVSNFTLVYAHPTGNWTLTGYVKNIEDYAVKRSIFKNGPDNVSELTIGPPRTYGGILSVNF